MCYNGRMKNTLLLITVIFLGMLAAFAAGRFFAPKQYEALPLAEIAPPKTTAAGSDEVSAKLAARLDALQAQYDALLKKYTALSQQQAAMLPTPPETLDNEHIKTPEEEKAQAELEARQKAWEERRAAHRERVMAHQATRIGFLADIDTTLLTEEQQATHAEYTQALEERTALLQRIMQLSEEGENPAPEEIEALRETSRKLFSLRDQERDALFEAMGLTLGLSENELPEFTAAINEIYSSTSEQGGRPPMPPPQMQNGQPMPPPPGM